ncbi:MAG: hypothetical protein AB9861_02660 [Methanosarcina sp.]
MIEFVLIALAMKKLTLEDFSMLIAITANIIQILESIVELYLKFKKL